MRIRLLLFMLGTGTIMLLPSAGHAGVCNVTPVSPAPSAAVRGSVGVGWTWSGGCGHHAPANTVAVTVNRPAAAGGGSILLGTVTYPAASISWPTAGGSFPDAAGYSLSFVISGTSAGNAATTSALTVDNTAPVLGAGARDSAPNAGGWHNEPVTVTWTCLDATSGVDQTASTLSVTRSSDGTDQTADAICIDKAGNTVTSSEDDIDIDATPPAIQVESRTAANDAGWNDEAVVVVWSCEDGLSGAETAQRQQTLESEGAGQSATETCTDLAGNTAGNTVSNISIDRTDPGIELASRTPANGNGWNAGAVTVVWSCSDVLSGPEDATVEQVVASDGADQSVNGACVDAAGNDATDSVGGINVDTSNPSIALTSRTGSNGNGWNAGDVNLSWSCSDELSGVEDATQEQTVTTDGEGQSATATCADLAGNTDSDTQTGINIDTGAPSIALASRTPANGAGWNNGDVTVAWSCGDALSGAETTSVSETLDLEGAGQSASGTCRDLAGNTASDAVGDISIDSTDPGIEFASRTPANDNGWNAGDVTVQWLCADGLSGAVDATVSRTVTTDGEGQSATGECTDLAGNTASDEQDGISIDTVSPVIALASRTPANEHGWNNGAVTIEWTCDDALSGAASGGDSATIAIEGAGQSATGDCVDLAGNTASDTQSNVNIDTTAPAAAVGEGAVYVRFLDGTMTLAGVDALSGIASMRLTVTNLLGESQELQATCVAGCGTSAATFEADLSAIEGAGIFTAAADAVDRAGNASDTSAPVTVVII